MSHTMPSNLLHMQLNLSARSKQPLPAACGQRPAFRSVLTRAAADSSPTDSSSSFRSGQGRIGTVTSNWRRSSNSFEEASTTGRPLASSETIKEAQNNAKLFLSGELARLFVTGKLTKEEYTNDFSFQDPVAKYSGVNAFQAMLRVLQRLFKIDFTVHSLVVSGDTEITSRWSMELTPRLIPWVQRLVFTGRSFYTIDVLSGGKIRAQRDVWDAVKDNHYLSLEGVFHLIQQLTNRQSAPKLDSPKFVVWKKTREYEIRRYRPYLTAEVGMPANARPASGDGFNDLAGYIFGGNQGKLKMEMTMPVFSTAGQERAGKMEFPIEEQMGDDVEGLPVPNNARVTRKRQDEATVAVVSFGGWPLDFQVTEAERKLRGVLLLDGLKPREGYKLARYNDPFTLPGLRRNEVLIKLEDYELEPAA